MIKELRKMRAKGGKDRATANYVARLQAMGTLKQYINSEGYACYDTEEYENYRANVKMGRPLKNKANVVVIGEED